MAPRSFYRIVAVVGYGLTVVFWLAAWAWSASSATVWLDVDARVGGALAGCAALGAVAWYASACLFFPVLLYMSSRDEMEG
jgi:hypothetical protein